MLRNAPRNCLCHPSIFETHAFLSRSRPLFLIIIRTYHIYSWNITHTRQRKYPVINAFGLSTNPMLRHADQMHHTIGLGTTSQNRTSYGIRRLTLKIGKVIPMN